MERSTPLISTDLPGALTRRQGKVRDIYEYAGERLLIVASDRISTFDVVMGTGVPGKGRILTQISLFWFGETEDIVANHLVSADVADFPAEVQAQADILEGRSMLTRKAEVIPVECVVRGYIAGAGWKEYQQEGTVGGQGVPAGLVEGDKLPEPLFTPTTKAEAGHDESISFDQVAELVGAGTGAELRDKAIELYSCAAAHASSRGLILADTKFEFGVIDGKLRLIDEALTPDSSRYWDMAQYEPGRPLPSFDKQYVRDYVESLDWNKEPPGPELPDEVVARTVELYEETWRRLTSAA